MENSIGKNRGFQKHEKVNLMLKHFLHGMNKLRDISGNTIGSLLVDKQIENKRYYIKSIFEIIQFLVVK